MIDAFRPAIAASILAHVAGAWLLPSHLFQSALPGQRGQQERISVVGVVELPSPELPAPSPRRHVLEEPLRPLKQELLDVPVQNPSVVDLRKPRPLAIRCERPPARRAPRPQELPPPVDAPPEKPRPPDYQLRLPVTRQPLTAKTALAPDRLARLRAEELREAARDYQPPKPPRQHWVASREQPGSRRAVRRSNADIRSRYLAGVLQRLQRAKYFPRQARSRAIGGTAEVEFVILADGRLAGVELARSSGSPALDRAARVIVERASPFDPLPGDLRVRELRLVVPVAFRLEVRR